jgi:hypothetical protein
MPSTAGTILHRAPAALLRHLVVPQPAPRANRVRPLRCCRPLSCVGRSPPSAGSGRRSAATLFRASPISRTAASLLAHRRRRLLQSRAPSVPGSILLRAPMPHPTSPSVVPAATPFASPSTTPATASSAFPFIVLANRLLHRPPHPPSGYCGRRAPPPTGRRTRRAPPPRRAPRPCLVCLGSWQARLGRPLLPAPTPLCPTGAWPLDCLRLASTGPLHHLRPAGGPSTVRDVPLQRNAPGRLSDAALFCW